MVVPFLNGMAHDIVAVPGGSELGPAILADLARRGADHGVRTPLFDLATMQLRVYNNSRRPPR